MAAKIAVVDYGMGNLRSVAQALAKVAGNARVIVTADPAEVAAADRVVFPGQGAMPDCMAELSQRNLAATVQDAACKKPFLGICIGLQSLFTHSAEGDVPGFDLFSGEVLRFPEARMSTPDGTRLKVPHMGWNRVAQKPHPLWKRIEDSARFYFVHSYYVRPNDDALTFGTTNYGLSFTSAAGRANIFAVQFHPEKSARDGLQLLQNFIDWNP